MFNIFSKKKLIAVVFILFLSVKAFGNVGLGIKFGADFGNYTWWQVGTTMGFGNMKGRPFIVNVLFHGDKDLFSLTPGVDWHFLPWNIGIVQLYMGVGIATELAFGIHNSQAERKYFSAVFAGRLPLGVKVFLNQIELFTEIAPQIGVEHVSQLKSSSTTERDRSNFLYWSIGLHMGLRGWF